jgi:hypothetical protein
MPDARKTPRRSIGTWRCAAYRADFKVRNHVAAVLARGFSAGRWMAAKLMSVSAASKGARSMRRQERCFSNQ